MTEDYSLNIFCKNIRILRITNRLTQKDMAKKLGICVNSLRSIESGVIPERLGCNVFFNAAKSFRIPISSLFLPFSGMEGFY